MCASCCRRVSISEWKKVCRECSEWEIVGWFLCMDVRNSSCHHRDLFCRFVFNSSLLYPTTINMQMRNYRVVATNPTKPLTGSFLSFFSRQTSDCNFTPLHKSCYNCKTVPINLHRNGANNCCIKCCDRERRVLDDVMVTHSRWKLRLQSMKKEVGKSQL